MPQQRAMRKASIFNDIASKLEFTRCYPYRIR